VPSEKLGFVSELFQWVAINESGLGQYPASMGIPLLSMSTKMMLWSYSVRQ
jgi:hypothetical protein